MIVGLYSSVTGRDRQVDRIWKLYPETLQILILPDLRKICLVSVYLWTTQNRLMVQLFHKVFIDHRQGSLETNW